ncbi:transglycosylase SLT domain-containing protein [Streptomyces sp. NPDC006012]|uniref:aggregation-promoting factor C-terminal-like domain-containing protein n=1 Tax=Streptomyces sp. NPDC006012 TaxID=3364739 RepID=UPI00367B1469
MSVSRIRRIATPKKAIAVAALVAATTSTALASTAAQAATPTGLPVQAMAKKMIPDAAQWNAFNEIVTRESGWNASAANQLSGAYGLFQAMPGSKMASAGSDWKTNPATQIKWGLNYMNSRYGSPVGAWKFWQSHGWY